MIPIPVLPALAHKRFQYIIINLGMSPGFGDIDFAHLTFPATMKVDWIRVYQLPGAKNIGCDPPDFPTAAYINR
jgi:beta-glucanase (GH16 family)